MAKDAPPTIVQFLDDAPVSRRGKAAEPPDPALVEVCLAGLQSGKWGKLTDEKLLSPLNKAATSAGVFIKTRRESKDGPLFVQFVDRDLYYKEKAERKAARAAKAAQQ